MYVLLVMEARRAVGVKEVMWSSVRVKRVLGMWWIGEGEVVEWISSGWMNSGGMRDSNQCFHFLVVVCSSAVCNLYVYKSVLRNIMMVVEYLCSLDIEMNRISCFVC